MTIARVLIVDDSAFVRDILARGLAGDPGIEVVGTAQDPFDARDKIIKLRPNVMTLDVEMPRMTGIEFLSKLLPQYPIPVVMVSGVTAKGSKLTLQALDLGAVDFVQKPRVNVERDLPKMVMDLRFKVKMAVDAKVIYKQPEAKPTLAQGDLKSTFERIVVIGASTGGTQAISTILKSLPPNFPGVLIVQHMPSGFTSTFAQQLHECSSLDVKEASEGDRVMTGQALLAPGGRHMVVTRSGDKFRVGIKMGDPVSGHCPSVDVLMESAAQVGGPNATGVLLTGMGRDGAVGLKAMRDAGAHTIGQDEKTSVVYGMPREAKLLGAVESEISLDLIAGRLLTLLKTKSSS